MLQFPASKLPAPPLIAGSRPLIIDAKLDATARQSGPGMPPLAGGASAPDVLVPGGLVLEVAVLEVSVPGVSVPAASVVVISVCCGSAGDAAVAGALTATGPGALTAAVPAGATPPWAGVPLLHPPTSMAASTTTSAPVRNRPDDRRWDS